VAHLEQFMEKTEESRKGKILLATVKGDVHDIGKNLVEIILGNNGFDVINLGIKVTPEQLVQACREHNPDLIGLSGLLVKSAQQMVITAQDLRAAGIDKPLLVGGAALTRKFTATRIAPEYDGLVLYAKDAMDGLELANKLSHPEQAEKLRLKVQQEQQALLTPQQEVAATEAKAIPSRSPEITFENDTVLPPPDCDRHILRDYPLGHLQPYLNLRMLLGKHLGLKGNVEALLASGDEKATELKAVIDELLALGNRDKIIRPQGMYRFFPAQSDGNKILIYDPQDHSRVLETFDFPRQQVEPYLCLSDFLRPVESGIMDTVGFLVVTAGQGVTELANRWKEEGHYLRSHALQALALELAEAFAERVHHIMRDAWGFPDPADFTMQERFGARYQGIRVSFGYPACPNLDDQQQLFRLLTPADIGVQLTDGSMMDPEASVSALVFSHQQARYFNA
ncbi:MAG TPA: vitamin B12 dependent-methionine synthase activation domain-containing protein, partial [Bacilli bacterium]|nr:vitamin B12 dependent-methionine synthase activation domain-containing protein [Bacilli bacterium]